MASSSKDFKVDGLKDLYKQMQRLPAQVEKKLLRPALRAGTNVFKARAKALVAPLRDSGALERSLRVRTRTRRGWVTATLVAGNREAFYAQMVEFGTAAHLIQADTVAGKSVAATINKRSKKSGALSFNGVLVSEVHHPGARPNPFMRPALDGGEQKALEATADYLRKNLPKAMEKQRGSI